MAVLTNNSFKNIYIKDNLKLSKEEIKNIGEIRSYYNSKAK